MIKIKKYLTILLLLFIVSCDDGGTCILAQDFGQPRAAFNVLGTSVNSRYSNSDGNPVYQYIEYSKPMATGYVLDGEELIMRISGAWSPWSEELEEEEEGFLNGIESENCKRPKNKICNDSDFTDSQAGIFSGLEFKKQYSPGQGCSKIDNICWFANGLGAYIVFSKGDKDEDLRLSYHLHGGSDFISTIEHGRGWTKVVIRKDKIQEIRNNINQQKFESIRIYIKIHDNQYGNNSNGCFIEDALNKTYNELEDGDIYKCNRPLEIFFEKGAKAEKLGFLEDAATTFIEPAKSMIEDGYKTFVESEDYNRIYILVWILSVCFFAIGYLMGFLQLNYAQLFSFIIKSGIVATLLSPGSWAFFEAYVVDFFWYGSIELANMVLESARDTFLDDTIINISSNVQTSILRPADEALYMMISYPVTSKILALIFSHNLGLFMLIAMYFSFWVFFIAMLKIAVIFVFIYITMAILLVLAPIFILFLFFKYTRENYFDPWIQALVSVTIQPMLIFVFMGFFLSLISGYIKQLLFYEVCWLPWVKFLGLYAWKVSAVYTYPGKGLPEKDISMTDPTKYRAPTPEEAVEIDGATLDIGFVDVFIVFISAMIIRYLVDETPKIAESLAGGFSLGKIGAGVMKLGGIVDRMGPKIAGKTVASAHRRTTGRMLSYTASRLLPQAVSSRISKLTFGLVNKTDAERMRNAKKNLRKELRSKGWKDSEIETAMKSGKLKGKLEDQIIREKAKDKRYGRKSLNPINIIRGAKKEIMDNIKMSYKESVSGNMTKRQKRRLKDSLISSEMTKLKKKKDFSSRVNKVFASKYGDNDLHDVVNEIANYGGNKNYNIEDLRNIIAEKLEQKGYDRKTADDLIDRDLDAKIYKGALSAGDKSFSRIKSAFPDAQHSKSRKKLPIYEEEEIDDESIANQDTDIDQTAERGGGFGQDRNHEGKHDTYNEEQYDTDEEEKDKTDS